ncbi:hypothetical protein DEU56DRAFT_760429 [Suillus clintonianus]|uniref:uncharacterized protein n=1 Tax=Suillus clintonianus TaxID=1904413 RepID=UPI001B85D88D|nr:uncharacterized protein DEU56DRAFT_760429 [Suillus clintonianus]KAG2122247.1 hypothetical protein DEU56DRAFT_760429 [Suillus clintonianus]
MTVRVRTNGTGQTGQDMGGYAEDSAGLRKGAEGCVRRGRARKVARVARDSIGLCLHEDSDEVDVYIRGYEPVGILLPTPSSSEKRPPQILVTLVADKGNTTPPKSCPVSSKWRRLRVFVEVPQAPASWRLKAIQRHSLDFEPNNSDLIPQITAIRNDEVGVGAIKDGAIDDEEAANDATMEDEEEIDELFASQERT